MVMPRFYGERIMLREYKKEDLMEIRKWVNNANIVDNLSDIFICPVPFNSTESFLNSVLESKDDSKNFVIADKKTESYIGQIDLRNINWKNRVAEIGIVIGDEEKLGKGYGSEAIKLLQEFSFERLNLNRLQLTVHDYNKRAFNCYKKCGFKQEGRLRQSFYKDGKYTDMIYMGILKSEFDKIKKQEKQNI